MKSALTNYNKFGIVSILVLIFLSCNFTFTPVKPLEAEKTVNLDTSKIRQVIEGFGGSNAWLSLPVNTSVKNELVQLLYSKENGIGLTILRNRIPFRELNKDGNDDKFVNKDGTNQYIYSLNNGAKWFSLNWSNWDLQNTKNLISLIKALPDGPEKLIVMSTPWTPPNNSVTQWKLNVPNITDYPEVGGYLDPSHYIDYADLLADYVLQFPNQMGHDLSVLSIQNEPTWEPNYESCKWDGNQIRDFIKILGTRFPLKNVPSTLRIMAPEDENFREDLILPALADQEARNVLSIVGVHQYDYAFKQNMAAQKLNQTKYYNKALWMTEVSDGGPNDGSIQDGLLWAKVIHHDMVLAEVNAFLYWWLWTNTGLTNQSGGSLLHVINGAYIQKNKRFFTLGQYSRFIRPGYSRIDISSEPLPGLLLSSYISPDKKTLIVVGINTNDYERNLGINSAGLSLQNRIRLWRTSEMENLAAIDISENVSIANGTVVIRFLPTSVTTLVIDL